MWIVRNVLLQMRPTREIHHNDRVKPLYALPKRYEQNWYIPAKLPSHKVPGTKTIGPVAEQSANCVATIRLANQMARQ